MTASSQSDSPRAAARRSWRPYRVIAVSLYDIESSIAEHLTEALRHAGWPRANRSFVIREALLRLHEEIGHQSAAEILRSFVERQAKRTGPPGSTQGDIR